VDICHVNDYLTGKGWRMNGLQSPPGFHFCITRPQTVPGLADRFLGDLREAVAYAAGPPPEPSKSGAIYGGGLASVPPAMIAQFMCDHLDGMYAV
jgi:hypothetical protein